MDRPPIQSPHDRKVEEIAMTYKLKGFHVMADLAGWDEPYLVYSSRPDIIAHKGGTFVVIEVETIRSVHSPDAQKQARDFQRYADENMDVSFKVVLA